jgi:hypothetical protein
VVHIIGLAAQVPTRGGRLSSNVRALETLHAGSSSFGKVAVRWPRALAARPQVSGPEE